ncbi:MAG: MBL fold metallo-hydrolase [Candidatus Roizmanbacteria bacterium]|nr:MBL fold metallo-hydrolase [Candidatus Roizmanbacteria bacterium]
MLKVDVLIQGAADFSKEIWFDYCSTTLITTAEGKRIIVDPGSNRILLLEKLGEHNLQINDIDYVFITHSHLDHSLLAGVFPKAIVVTGSQWWKDGVEIHNHDGSYFGKNIKIIKTSGHSHSDSYLIVDIDKKKICVAGDIFWWDKHEIQEVHPGEIVSHLDRFAIDMQKLTEVRMSILKVVSYVIPGHGKPFIIDK